MDSFRAVGILLELELELELTPSFESSALSIPATIAVIRATAALGPTSAMAGVAVRAGADAAAAEPKVKAIGYSCLAVSTSTWATRRRAQNTTGIHRCSAFRISPAVDCTYTSDRLARVVPLGATSLRWPLPRCVLTHRGLPPGELAPASDAADAA